MQRQDPQGTSSIEAPVVVCFGLGIEQDTGNQESRKYEKQIYAHADPRNADRALWGELAVVSFASVTGQRPDVYIDPETVLGDLLADFMHWCDIQKASDSRIESIDFESALKRARNHYDEECVDEREQLQADDGDQQ